MVVASAHGLNTAINSKTWQRKAWWGLVFAVCCILCIILFVRIVQVYFDRPVIVANKFVYGNIPFPAVTICNMNAVKRSQLFKVPELEALHEAYDELMDELAAEKGDDHSKLDLSNNADSNLKKEAGDAALERSKRESGCYGLMDETMCFDSFDPCSNDATYYLGNKSTALSGVPCINWSTPNTTFPEFQMLPENLCRITINSSGGPWCLVAETNWEYCFDACAVYTTKTLSTTTTVKKFTAESKTTAATSRNSKRTNNQLKSTLPVTGCPVNWLAVNCKCFKHAGFLNQFNAQQACQAFGSNYTLPIFRNLADVNDYVQARNALIGSVVTWISGNDKTQEGQFVFENGHEEPLPFTNFVPPEPNDPGHITNCLSCYPSGTWNDNYCSTQYHFLCQHKYEPCGWCMKLYELKNWYNICH